MNIQIAPLLGFETVYRSYPNPHTATHQVLGARLIIGYDRIAGEAEYTQGTDTENFATAPETVKFTEEKLKLGLRYSMKLTSLFVVQGRLGGQAKKIKTESISGGISTTDEQPIKYDPYAGLAAGVHLGPKATINVGITAVFHDINDMSKNDYQTEISVGMGI